MKKRQQYLSVTACLCLLISAITFQTALASQNRVALVIGNSRYAEAPLANPVNDAKAMSAQLTRLGFDVILRTNSNKRSMIEAIGEFGVKLEKQGGVGLFFYAGHGIQSKGQNYLIPVNAHLKRETELEFEAVNAARILKEMGYANNGLNIVILDACRNNPLTRSFRSAKRGLARIDDAPSGLLLAYSTAPGSVAADGNGRNSPYTTQLINAMGQTGWSLEKVFKQAAREVKRETRGEQIPWVSSSITGDFYFSGKGQSDLPAPIQVASADPDIASKDEREFWGEVKSDPSKEMYEAYLAEYPNGHYARIAHIKLKKYQLPAQASQPDINQQLKVCQTHLNANRLTSGRGGNALACYEQILSEHPGNNDALTGLKQIEDKYAVWAKSQINKRRYSKAKVYLKKIALINPDSEQLSQLEDLLKEKETLAQQSPQPLSRPSGGSRSITDSATGVKLVKIPQGCFQMGSNNGEGDEKPVHKVCITKPFYLGKYEVTQGQWQAIMGNNPSEFKKGNNHPVENVSWNDVQRFIKKLNTKTGKNYRLPTEAEWEYACRSGGKNQKYCGGDSIDSLGWHDEGWKNGHHAVGGKSPNGLGLYDMSGNVWEWVQDRYGENYYQSSPTNNPTGPSGGSFRGDRGGSWGSSASYARSAFRRLDAPSNSSSFLGFRLARSF
ncbi:MAG TPA: hypothetical protein ENJ60_01180 [Aeromonadales bacterium]|nr:hypothetical protein [Aeromonadales bacterium]